VAVAVDVYSFFFFVGDIGVEFDVVRVDEVEVGVELGRDGWIVVGAVSVVAECGFE
jgi:hypothetical protein